MIPITSHENNLVSNQYGHKNLKKSQHETDLTADILLGIVDGCHFSR